MAFKVTEFPYCCGAAIMSNLGFTGCTVGASGTVSQEVVTSHIKKMKKDNQGLAFLLTILNEEQMEAIGHLFEKEGFVIINKGYNDNHHHILYILCYTNPIPDDYED
jgi:hypothetical protein